MVPAGLARVAAAVVVVVMVVVLPVAGGLPPRGLDMMLRSLRRRRLRLRFRRRGGDDGNAQLVVRGRDHRRRRLRRLLLLRRAVQVVHLEANSSKWVSLGTSRNVLKVISNLQFVAGKLLGNVRRDLSLVRLFRRCRRRSRRRRRFPHGRGGEWQCCALCVEVLRGNSTMMYVLIYEII